MIDNDTTAGTGDSTTPDAQTDAAAAASSFTAQAEEQEPGLVREFVDFLRHNKKWWLTPIIAVMLLVGLLVLIGGTGAAPFIYTLF